MVTAAPIPNDAIEPRRSARVAALDGVRGVAVLMVTAAHFIPELIRPHTGDKYALWVQLFGAMGVDMFFVLSGFLLASTLIRVRTQPNYYSAFYTRRLSRTLPLYFAVLGAVVALMLIFPGTRRKHQTIPLTTYFLLLQNFTMGILGKWGGALVATWSLAVEEQFYLLLPLVVRLTNTGTLAWTAIGAWIMAELSVPIVARLIGPIASYTFPICRMNALAAGVLCAIVVIRKFQIPGLWLRVLGLVSVCGMILALRVSESTTSWGARTFAIPGFASLLLLCLRPGLASKLFSNRVLVYIGTISYGIYLFQLPVLSLMIDALGLNVLSSFIALVITFAISAVSWSFFESKVVAWGHRTGQYGKKPLANRATT